MLEPHIRPKSEQEIKVALEWIIKHGNLESNNSISYDEYPGFYREILYGSVSIEDLTSADTRAAILLSITNFFKERNERDPNLLGQYYKSLSRAIETIRLELKNFTVIVFLNLLTNNIQNIEKIVFQHGTVDFIKDEDFQEYDLASLKKSIEETGSQIGIDYNYLFGEPDLKRFYPIRVETFGYTSEAARERAYEIIEVISAALNFASVSRIYTKTDGKPMGSILPPYIEAVFDDNKNYVETIAVSRRYFQESNLYKVTEGDVRNMQEITKRINSSHGLAGFLENILQLYQRASIEPFNDGRFLALWQVLETLCLDTPDAKRKVSTRIAKLIGSQSGSSDHSLVGIIERKRHDLVHANTGYPNVIDTLVYILKQYVTFAIRQLISLWDMIDNMTEWEEYLNTVFNNNTEIESIYLETVKQEERLLARRKILDLIKKERRNMTDTK
jgi:hypothetical protein